MPTKEAIVEYRNNHLSLDPTPDFDPFFGLEKIRRNILDLSKPAFYGPGGIVHDLPVTQLSARRKGVRKSELERVLAERTRTPRKTPHCAIDPS